MKKMFVFIIGFAAISLPAHASGCMGGIEPTYEQHSLPPTEIKTQGYNGDPQVSFKVFHGTGWIEGVNVGSETVGPLIFQSKSYDLSEVADLMTSINHLIFDSPSVMASTVEFDRTSPPDDCGVAPRVRIQYSLGFQLADGQKQEIVAYHEFY